MYTHRTPQEMFNEELEHAIKVAERKYILLENEEGEETTFEESETYAEDHKAYAKYLQSLIDTTNSDVVKELEKIKAEIKEESYSIINIDGDFYDLVYRIVDLDDINEIIDKHITVLKGE